ncbi:MAG: hypothetical protein P9M13_07500 [Candidatus Ancaeobacter aquaticus]|nr:hypothetical protein [Candidatus Ancaeobacter aquaticus]
MIEYLAYGVLLTIGFHIGGKISKKCGLGPNDDKRVKLHKYKGQGINTKTYVSKLYGGF